jgi:predicted nucleotidyltransferase
MGHLLIEVHQELIRLLLDAGVEFIVIGGYAVIFHGYRRTTGDIDIWLRPDNRNKEKLLPVLREFGFDENEINEVAAIDFTRHMVFSIGEQPEKIDFLTRISLVQYDDADKKKIMAEADGMLIPFLHIDDLVLSKINTGRTKDKADIDMLQLIDKAKRKL